MPSPPRHRIAVIYTFNDLEKYENGSQFGIKQDISYFDQFLISMLSIRAEWQSPRYDLEFHVVHSLPFAPAKKERAEKLGATFHLATNRHNNLAIRNAAYAIPLDCDYRLVIDNDLIATSDPNLALGHDVYAMYGGNKYNAPQWRDICGHLGCRLPPDDIQRTDPGGYYSWSYHEHYLYQSGSMPSRMFPYFNNGAIMVRNTLARQLGDTWNALRIRYRDYVARQENIDTGLDGQDVIGLAISETTDDWHPFPVGVNYIANERFDLSNQLLAPMKSSSSLIHYINVTPQSWVWARVNQIWKSLDGAKPIQPRAR